MKATRRTGYMSWSFAVGLSCAVLLAAYFVGGSVVEAFVRGAQPHTVLRAGSYQRVSPWVRLVWFAALVAGAVAVIEAIIVAPLPRQRVVCATLAVVGVMSTGISILASPVGWLSHSVVNEELFLDPSRTLWAYAAAALLALAGAGAYGLGARRLNRSATS